MPANTSGDVDKITVPYKWTCCDSRNDIHLSLIEYGQDHLHDVGLHFSDLDGALS